jgi:Uma2 family endonuclease
MATIEARNTYTPADLLTMPEAERFELVDGNLVERNVGVNSGLVELELASQLLQFCKSHGLGLVWGPSTGIQCFSNRNTVRKPDAFFVRRERIQSGWGAAGFVPVAPDLAVEVISPGDLASEVDRKVNEYLNVGVRLVWIVHPEAKYVVIRRINGTMAILGEADSLDGEDVVPGFRLPLKSLLSILLQDA